MRRWWLMAAAATACSACCQRHVQLMFPAHSQAAETYACDPATGGKPEDRRPNCKRVSTVDPALLNQSHTTPVDLPRCETAGGYYSITTLNADSSNPKIYVICAQDETLH
jgi:hypothetical protein